MVDFMKSDEQKAADAKAAQAANAKAMASPPGVDQRHAARLEARAKVRKERREATEKSHEAAAEAHKQAWLNSARYGAAEEEVREEAMDEARVRIAAAKVDSKTEAEMMLKAKGEIEAAIAENRKHGYWPRTKAEIAYNAHHGLDRDGKPLTDEQKAELAGEPLPVYVAPIQDIAPPQPQPLAPVPPAPTEPQVPAFTR